MGYNKFILSGKELELYEYEKQCFNRGRPRGYKVNFNRENLGDSGDSAFQQRKFARRKDNASRASMAFKRLVQSNLGTGENPVFCTLTFKENRTDLSECAGFFKLFVLRMRYTFGKDFRYVAVPEFQKRGAVHYHALFWGLPESIVVRERQDRKIAELWGQGFIDLMETDGSGKLATYLAKYMVKAISDIRLLFHKAYFASRNVFRPVVSAGFPMWWFDEEFLPDAQIKFVKEYETSWLGRAKLSVLELSTVLPRQDVK